MLRRIFQGACVLVLLHGPLAWSQEVPILPPASSVLQLAKEVPVDKAHPRTLSAPSTRSITGSASSVVGGAELQALQLISLSPDLLRAPVSGANGDGQLSLGGARPKAAVPLAVTIDGRYLELAAIAETQDPSLIYRYVTAQVLNVPNAYARFIVAGEQIVGTIVTPQATYRLLPAGARQVSVHRLPQQGERSPKFRKIVAPENVSEHAMERRHVLMERLAQLQPKHAFVNEAGHYFSAKGGAFGKLTGAPSAQVVQALINGIADVTYAPESLSVHISSVTKHAGRTTISFEQAINGIPVSGSNQLVTDAKGTVLEITTQFVDPALASDQPIMSEADARKRAIRQIEFEAGDSASDYEQLQPTTLSYAREGAGPAKLVPYYTFSLSAQPRGQALAVRVNAHSGEARVLMNPPTTTARVSTRFPPRRDPTCPA